jgi:Fe(3+) dicitrate transport protein
MEDGVLISPAPYSAPAAYYFGEQNAIFRNIKGGSQIQYGPYTTGGAINMVSTQIPRRFQAVLLPVGSFNTKKTYVNMVTNIKLWIRIRIQQSKFRWIQND